MTDREEGGAVRRSHITAPRRDWRRYVRQGVLAATGAAALLTVASWLGSAHWLLELLTHFRVHYAGGALALVVAAAVLRQPATTFMALAVAATNLAAASPYLLTGTLDVQAGHAVARIMSFNVHLQNRDYGRALALVEQEQPDIIGLLEVDEQWVDALSELRLSYPYTVLRPEQGAYGMALFSRFPVREASASPYVENGIQTAILVDVNIGDQTMSLILTHVKAPTSGKSARLRNLQLETIAGTIRRNRDREHILVGDLNVTPWSPHYRRLESESGLSNAARGRGYRPTWPAGYSPAGIPIDHCLLSAGLNAAQFRTGPDIGSDHLPIIIDVAVADHVQLERASFE